MVSVWFIVANYVKPRQKLAHYARGRHNFSRFIYHMTSKASYEAIIASGELETRMVE